MIKLKIRESIEETCNCKYTQIKQKQNIEKGRVDTAIRRTGKIRIYDKRGEWKQFLQDGLA